jgi:hypothetical protein
MVDVVEADHDDNFCWNIYDIVAVFFSLRPL